MTFFWCLWSASIKKEKKRGKEKEREEERKKKRKKEEEGGREKRRWFPFTAPGYFYFYVYYYLLHQLCCHPSRFRPAGARRHCLDPMLLLWKPDFNITVVYWQTDLLGIYLKQLANVLGAIPRGVPVVCSEPFDKPFYFQSSNLVWPLRFQFFPQALLKGHHVQSLKVFPLAPYTLTSPFIVIACFIVVEVYAIIAIIIAIIIALVIN